MSALAQYQQSKVCGESRAYGEQVARLGVSDTSPGHSCQEIWLCWSLRGHINIITTIIIVTLIIFIYTVGITATNNTVLINVVTLSVILY